MTRSDLATHIRISLSILGRDPYVKLPTRKAALEAQWALLRIELKARGKLKDKRAAE